MNTVSRFPLWRIVFWLIMAAGIVAGVSRFYYGLGASTNLSDQFPWGIWIGVRRAVRRGAGGGRLHPGRGRCTSSTSRRIKPIVRPAILTAFLGYMLVVGRAAVRPGAAGPHLAPADHVEPALGDVRSGLVRDALHRRCCSWSSCRSCSRSSSCTRAQRLLHGIMLPLMIVGVILSTLHQSSLGSLFLIVPTQAASAVVLALAAGAVLHLGDREWAGDDDLRELAQRRAFGRHLELRCCESMARVLAVVIAVYLAHAVPGPVAPQGAHGAVVNRVMSAGSSGWKSLLMAGPMLLFCRERIAAESDGDVRRRGAVRCSGSSPTG